MATTLYDVVAPLEAGQTYPSDMTDAEWAIVAPLLSQPDGAGRPAVTGARS